MFDVLEFRKEFPILSKKVNDKPLVYLDNGASSQKPIKVIEAVKKCYESEYSNVHRGLHYLSNLATEKYEAVRDKVVAFLGASFQEEIIFTSGSTEALNLVSYGWANQNLVSGDEIILSTLEHHANIVPWQMLAERKRAIIKVLPITQDGEWDCSNLKDYINSKTKIVAFNSVSNALGTINPIHILVDAAHTVGAITVVDGAQSAPHQVIDVNEWNVDFFTSGGHKMYGPTGIGILYGKKALLENMPPWQGGGEMIAEVTFEKTTYADLPHKFEAGTPNIAGGIAFGAALDYLNSIGMEKIAEYEEELLTYATAALKKIPGLKVYGEALNKTAVISFNVQGIHPYDIGSILDKLGIAVRTGHHCAQPIMDFYRIPGTVRASFSFYNTFEEIDTMVKAVEKAVQMLK